jgi:hypothetical protein
MKGKRERDNTQEHTRKSTRPCVISHEEKEGHTHRIQTYTRPLYTYIGGDAHAESSEVIANGMASREGALLSRTERKKKPHSPLIPPRYFQTKKKKKTRREK